VLFDDDLVLPFQRLRIPYEQFVLRLPSRSFLDGSFDLFAHLEGLLRDGTALRMQKALWDWAPRLQFHLPFPEVPEFPLKETPTGLQPTGDSFDGIMLELAARSAEVKRRLGT
jgi:hypothetical protein